VCDLDQLVPGKFLRGAPFTLTLPSWYSRSSGEHSKLCAAIAISVFLDRFRGAGGRNPPPGWTPAWVRGQISVRARSPGPSTFERRQEHESLVLDRAGRILERDHRDDPRGTADHSPSTVAAAWRSSWGCGRRRREKTIKETLIAIAAHNFECSPEDLEYHDGSVNVKGAPSKKFSWDQLVEIAHRRFHKLPPGLEPGLQAKFVLGSADRRRACRRPRVASRSTLATPSRRTSVSGRDRPGHRQARDPEIRLRPRLRGDEYNPDIVHGNDLRWDRRTASARRSTRSFAYTEDGQLASGTFIGLPDHRARWKCRTQPSSTTARPLPSPLSGRRVRAKPVISARPPRSRTPINDALDPLGAAIDALPMSHLAIWKAINDARRKTA